MPIRYCRATSKRTGQRCRARAMRGQDVCYHHGGASLRGIAHPNYRHGYYSQSPLARLILLTRFDQYRAAVRRRQQEAILDDLANGLPLEQYSEYRRFQRAYLAAVAQQPVVKLTPALAAWLMDDRSETA